MEKNVAISGQEPSGDAAYSKTKPTSLIGEVLTWYALISLVVAGIAGGIAVPSSYSVIDSMVPAYTIWAAGIAHAMFFIAIARILDYLKMIAEK